MSRILKLLTMLLIAAFVISGCAVKKTDPEKEVKEEVSESAENALTEAAETEVKEKEAETAIEDPAETTVAETTAEETEKQEIKIMALSGPTGMGLAKLIDDSEQGLTANSYQLSIAAAPDNLVAAATKGEADILAMPSNLASVLWNKTEGNFQVITVNTLGVLYIVENGETIQSIEDLKGKKVFASGKGATPEYAFQYLLSEYGLDPEDVEIEWKAEHAEVVSAMAVEENSIALLPQPFVTVASSKIENLRIAIDLNEAWSNLKNDSAFVMGVMVASKDFVIENPEVTQAFLEEYASSVAFVNDNPSEGSKLVEKHQILEKAAVAEKAIPYCNIVCLTGAEMESALSGYLEVLFTANPQSVGGALPDETFYFKP